MNKDALKKWEELRSDFQTVAGRPFQHFYCPILFRDEEAPLCRGHIINAAFRDSDRSWTIQRTDVDNFFGSFFEGEFLAIQERQKHELHEILTEPRLRRLFKPKITIDDVVIESYIPDGPVPPMHSELIMEASHYPTARLALKLEPSATLAALDGKWDVRVSRDLRCSALVSLLKVAHLTWFALLGYTYGLSAGGYFLGHEILGKFFLTHCQKAKPAIAQAAQEHFRQFANLVRPIEHLPAPFQGTISDRLLLLCIESSGPWGVLTIIRTEQRYHAVLVPMFQHPDGAVRFLDFLSENHARLEVKLAKFTGDRWEVAKDSQTIEWPASAFA